MKKLVTLALAASVALAPAAPLVAADHRDAPLITEDPAADINDMYVFPNPLDPNRVVLAMTVNPFSPPRAATASNFSPDVRYRFEIDSTNDALPDAWIDVTFTPVYPGPQRFNAFFSVGGFTVSGESTLPTFAKDANPAKVTEDAAHNVKVFAGPRDDPFFFDLVGFNRKFNTTPAGDWTKADTFAGFNVSIIVIECPFTLITPGTRVGPYQIWGETYRRAMTERHGKGDRPQESNGPWRLIERMGNPGISTVLIGSSKKDLFNLAEPRDDAALYAPDFADKLHKLGTNDANITILASVAVPDTLKYDPVQPARFPNGRAPAEDVIDILLYYIQNQPADPKTASDGVDANDKAFLLTFPYFAPPHQVP